MLTEMEKVQCLELKNLGKKTDGKFPTYVQIIMGKVCYC